MNTSAPTAIHRDSSDWPAPILCDPAWMENIPRMPNIKAAMND